MKKGVIILCRYNSTRLPGKILLKINDKPVLAHIINSVLKFTKNIVIATSDEESDNPIVRFCIEHNIDFFRGSLNDVSLRFLMAAENFNLDYAVRLNGDNFFVNQDVLKEVLNTPTKELKDFISNVPGRTFPYGMSIEMVNVPFYKKWYPHFSEQQKEHVTLFFYEHTNLGSRKEIYNISHPEAKELKLALDTKSDLKKIQFIFSHLNNPNEYSFSDLIETTLKYEK